MSKKCCIRKPSCIHAPPTWRRAICVQDSYRREVQALFWGKNETKDTGWKSIVVVVSNLLSFIKLVSKSVTCFLESLSESNNKCYIQSIITLAVFPTTRQSLQLSLNCFPSKPAFYIQFIHNFIQSTGYRIFSLIPCWGVRGLPPKKKKKEYVLDMTLKWIWYWGSSFGALGSGKSTLHCQYFHIHSFRLK